METGSSVENGVQSNYRGLYGAFKGIPISALLFRKRQVFLLSSINLDFLRRSFFPAAHFFFLRSLNFLFFFSLATFFWCSHFWGVLKRKNPKFLKALRLENEESNPKPSIWLTLGLKPRLCSSKPPKYTLKLRSTRLTSLLTLYENKIRKLKHQSNCDEIFRLHLAGN